MGDVDLTGDRELTALRRRQAELAERLDRDPGDTLAAGPALLVQVFAEAAVPTVALKYFACHPVKVGGAETEGTAPTLAADAGQKLYVAVLGTPVPVAGDYLIARLVGGRWVAGKGVAAPALSSSICPTVTACNVREPGSVVTVSNSAVASFARTAAGTGYTALPEVTFGGGGGSGAMARAVSGVGGTIASLTLIHGGTGYTSPPTVTLAGGGGSGAAFTASLTASTDRSTSLTCTTAEQVTGVTVVGAGSGYTSAPTVSFPVGGGSGATATANMSADGTAVASITVTNGGSGYVGAPTISFTGGGGIGARATATVSGAGVVTGIVVNLGGGGYNSAPTVAITPGVGSGAAATANMIATVASVTVTNGGTGYTTAPTATSSGGGGSGASYRPKLTATTVDTVTLAASGSNYTGVPAVVFTTPTGHTGSGATAAASMGLDSISNITNGGTGYTVGDLLTLSGGTSTTAGMLQVTSVSGGVITGAVISVAGTYTSLPTNPVAVTGGTGSGATFSLLWKIASVAVTAGGTNYSTAPTVAFSGGGGSGAGATAATVATSVGSVTVVTIGSGYSSAPILAFAGGGGGSGATAAVVLNPFTVGSVTVTAGGSGYASLPGVAFSGGGGSGATATAVVLCRCCVAVGAGTYTVSVGPPAGNANYWGGAANVTVAANATAIPTIALAGVIPYPAAGSYSNQSPGCAPNPEAPASCQTGPIFLAEVYPTTLFVNDGFGLVSLSIYDTSSGVPKYAGCATRTAAATGTSALCVSGAAGSVPVLFTLDRGLGAGWGGWTLTVSVPTCGTAPNRYPTTGTCTANPPSLLNDVGAGVSQGAGGSGVTSCTLLTLTAPVAMGTLASPPTPIQQVYGAGNVSMSVSP
jgi:hypothetical protein